jgi:DnaJ-class molecular chaperone
MTKLKIIKKVIKSPCYCCSVIGGNPVPQKECKTCNGTGIYKENFYYHIINGQCIDGDTIK